MKQKIYEKPTAEMFGVEQETDLLAGSPMGATLDDVLEEREWGASNAPELEWTDDWNLE